MNTLLVAMDEEHIIGNGNALPWRIPGELKLFRERTMGHVLIMGRNTWQSLPGKTPYLDGRVNFVVTRDADRWASDTEGCDETAGPHFVASIEQAIETAKTQYPDFAREIFIIGGRQIYDYALQNELVDRMFITHVKGTHKGDVKFPEIPGQWVGRSDYVDKQNDLFEIIEYVKQPS